MHAPIMNMTGIIEPERERRWGGGGGWVGRFQPYSTKKSFFQSQVFSKSLTISIYIWSQENSLFD